MDAAASEWKSPKGIGFYHQKKSGKEFERVTSEERKKQLERARAWRKSMNLEV